MTELTLDKLPKKVLARLDLQTVFMASRCVVAAEKLQVFRKLHGKRLSATAIGKKTGITGWRLKPFLAALISLGLLKKQGEYYCNSALAEKYYIRDRSIHWTKIYPEECQWEYEAFSVLEKMLTSGKHYEDILGKKRAYYLEKMRRNPVWADDFTRMLYYDHFEDSLDLSKGVNLSGYGRLLDVGGGSGVMAMALVRKFPNLQADILDISPVIKVARKIIRREKLSKRMKAFVGDMRKKIPSGYDVIMFCDQGSIDDIILQKAYDSLPEGGMIILAEDFSSEDWTEPIYRLMWQIRSREIWLITPKQAKAKLKNCGFKSIKYRRLNKDLGLVTGYKGSCPHYSKS